MKKIEKLSQEPSFGLPLKTRGKQKTGFGEKEIDTYAFTKIQAIAAGARINNAYLMQAVDELVRLTQINNTPQTFSQALAFAASQAKKIEQMQVTENGLRRGISVI